MIIIIIMMVRRLVCSLCGLGVCRSCSTLHSASQLWTCAQCNQQRWDPSYLLWLAFFLQLILNILETFAQCNQQRWDLDFNLFSSTSISSTFSGRVLNATNRGELGFWLILKPVQTFLSSLTRILFSTNEGKLLFISAYSQDMWNVFSHLPYFDRFGEPCLLL